MSKGPEPKDSGERRRRRGGLRVPSDNVPRRASSESDVSAPVPEALGLAASVSESFGVAGNVAVDGSQRIASERADSELDELATIVSEPTPAAPRLETDDESEKAAELLGDQHNGLARENDGRVEASHAPALLDPLADDIENIDDLDEDADDEIVTGEIAELPTPDDFDGEATRAEIHGEALHEHEPGTGESVDIPFDDGDEVLAASAGRPYGVALDAAETIEAPARLDPMLTTRIENPAAEVESPAADFESSAADFESPAADFDTPAADFDTPAAAFDSPAAEGESAAELSAIPTAPVLPAAGKGKKARFKRAMTMALSDADLEEVGTSEMDGGSAAAPVHALEPIESGDVLRDDEIEEIPLSQPPEAQVEAPVAAPEGTQAKQAEPPAPPPTPIAKAAATKPAAIPPKLAPKVAPPKPAPAPPQAAADEKRKRRKPWFEEIFDEDYLRTLPFLTPQATQFEANFVMESLGVDAGAQILDVGCGYGRHAMELAARGYHVVGLDSSLPLLLRGADEAQRRGLTINFVHGDMREMTFESQFDGAYCLFSSFGYFDDETNKRTAQNIAKALKPGARLVVEVLNRDYLVADLPSRVWWEGDGCVVLEEVEFNYFSSRIVSNRSVVFDDGRQLEHEISLRSFSLHELGKFLHAVGFRVLEISGSMSTRGRFFGAHSRDIVVVAERRASNGDDSQG